MGPEVTTICLSANCRVANARLIASKMEAGSAILPIPVSPHAIAPFSGPIIVIPSDLSIATFRWVAGFNHIRTFIAGAASTGLSVASRIVEARSSARPPAILARISAVAGATTSKSADRDNSMWPILASSRGLNSSRCTCDSDKAARESGVTNCSAAFVSTQETPAPESRSNRTRLKHL